MKWNAVSYWLSTINIESILAAGTLVSLQLGSWSDPLSWPAPLHRLNASNAKCQPFKKWSSRASTRPGLFTVFSLQHPRPENTWHSYPGRLYPDLRGAECICMSTPPHHSCLGPNTCFPFKATSERSICTFSINILTGCSVNLCQPSWETRWKRRQPSAGQLPPPRGEVTEGRG